MLAAELTREQIVNQLHEELPYATRRATESYTHRPDGRPKSASRSLVARDSQKAIVLGKRGAHQGHRRSGARGDQRAPRRPVHLFLHVKVNPRWDEDRALYKDIGLEWAD